MIWIDLPLPPSANEMYETSVVRIRKTNKHGKSYQGFKTGKRKADCLQEFQLKCRSLKNANAKAVKTIKEQCKFWIQSGYVLKVDSWFAFTYDRIWTKDGNPKKLDADNRRKALQDGLSIILDIDDCHFFSGIVEKVTCATKELQCSVIRISPIRPQTLDEIRKQRNMGAS